MPRILLWLMVEVAIIGSDMQEVGENKTFFFLTIYVKSCMFR